MLVLSEKPASGLWFPVQRRYSLNNGRSLKEQYHVHEIDA